MRKGSKSSDLTETVGLEVNLGHPGHQMKIPEPSQSLFNVRLNKVTLIPELLLSLSLLYEELAKQPAFLSIDPGPECFLKKTVKGPGPQQETGIYKGGEKPKITQS
jgi:hypothetical protein